MRQVVGVLNDDPLSVSHLGREVECSRFSLVGLVKDSKLLAANRIEFADASVGASVVDDDDFVIVVCLLKHAKNARLEIRTRIVGANNYCNVHSYPRDFARASGSATLPVEYCLPIFRDIS